MALVLANRVQETTTTTGTGTVTLAGAMSGFQSFAVVGNTNTTYYAITSGTAWEVGIGTYSTTGPTLARTTILSSSIGGGAITLAGTSIVFATYPSEKSVNYDASGNVGIGTTSPTQKLDVNGQIISDAITSRGNATEGGQLTLNNAANSAGVYFFDVDGSGHGRVFTTTNNTNLTLGQLVGTGGVVTVATSAAERMRIDTSGNVGIGTASPASKLDIASGDLRFSSTAQRILGDFSNATETNRLLFQSATTNGNTNVNAIPNGTSATAGIGVMNNADPTNTGRLSMVINSTETSIRSAIKVIRTLELSTGKRPDIGRNHADSSVGINYARHIQLISRRTRTNPDVAAGVKPSAF